MELQSFEQSPPSYEALESESFDSVKSHRSQHETVEAFDDLESLSVVAAPVALTTTKPKFRINWYNVLFFLITVLLYVVLYLGVSMLKDADNYENICQWREYTFEGFKNMKSHFLKPMSIAIIVMCSVPAIMMTLGMIVVTIENSQNELSEYGVLVLFISTIMTFTTFLTTMGILLESSPHDMKKCYLDNSRTWWFASYLLLPVLQIGLPVAAFFVVLGYALVKYTAKSVWTVVNGNNWFCCSYE